MSGEGYANDTNIQKPGPAVISDRNGSRKGTDSSDIQDKSGDILAGVPDVEVDLESNQGDELKRKISNVIPRRNRRGLFAQLVIGIPEIDDPVQYSPRTKNFIVFIIAIAAIAAPMGYYILILR
jgi:hypothetical protein